jgi:hypothetical protein
MIRTDIRYVDADGTLNQAGWSLFNDMQGRIAALEAKLAAAAAVANASGGATIDANVRAETIAIKAALA